MNLADLALDLPRFNGPALCAETDPDGFFPEKGSSPTGAKKLCARCDITAECLEWALARDERIGVWGGMTATERRGERRRRQQAAPKPPTSTPAPRPALVSLREPGQLAPRPWTTVEAREAIRTLTASGLSAADIAKQLGISARTVVRVRSGSHRTQGRAA